MEPDLDYREFFTHFHAFNGHGIGFNANFGGLDREMITYSGQNYVTAAFCNFSNTKISFSTNCNFKILRQVALTRVFLLTLPVSYRYFGEDFQITANTLSIELSSSVLSFESIHLKVMDNVLTT